MQSRNPRNGRVWMAGLLAAVLGISTALVGVATPAFALDGDVTVSKTATVSTVQPGQTFDYRIEVSCTTIGLGCVGAVLEDPVPAPFVVTGVDIDAGLAGTVDSSSPVHVTFTDDVAGSPGLGAARTGFITVHVQLPADTPYEANGVPITNTATTNSDTQAGPLDSSAVVTPDIPLELGVTTAKTFDPTSGIANPGSPVALSLTAGNISNAGVDSLVLQDPSDPTAAPNPFDLLAFTGFGDVVFPEGANQVQVDVFVDGAWVPGTPGATPVLPDGVDPATVKGVRFTFTDSNGGTIAAGATASVGLDLEQTAAVADLPADTVVANTVTAIVDRDGIQQPAEGGADYTIAAEDIVVDVGKSFSPAQVPAGEPSTATITAGNASAFPLQSLTVTEPKLPDGGDPFGPGFDSAAAFGGFAAPVTYPASASSASVTYFLADGTEQTFTFADGAVPPAPSGEVVRFSITFTGPIDQGATTALPFIVETDPDQVGSPATLTNTATASGEGPTGATAEADASADLQVFERHLDITVGKSIQPSEIINSAGEWVVVNLPTNLSPFPDSTSGAETIVVQDPVSPPQAPDVDPFWDAFELTEITQTAVPDGATLTVQYWDGTQWLELAGPFTGPTIANESIPDPPRSDVQGVRFTYTSTEPGGFPPGTTVEPHFRAELRDELVTGGDVPDGPISNCATATASADQTAGAAATVPEPCPVVTLDPADPNGADTIDKHVVGSDTVTARSGDDVTFELDWSTAGFSGIERMVVSDSTSPVPVSQSFFNAFDLTRVEPITSTMDPLLQYDQVTGVQIWKAGSGWTGIENDPCPSACDGTFPGVTLTAADRAAALAVRLVFEEGDGRASATDPNAPPVGSGVARSSGNDRALQLTFELRDLQRDPASAAVLGSATYNVAGQPGFVRNTATATGYVDDVPFIDASDSDDAIIFDVPLNVGVTKTWSGSPMGIPPAAVNPLFYPTGRVDIVATNRTAAKVDTLTIQDPAPGAASNPFEYFDTLDIMEVSVPDGATDTRVLLTHADGSTSDLSVTDAEAASEQLLEDVVGIEVVHTGRITAGATAELVLDLRLRKFERTAPATLVGVGASPIVNQTEATVDDLGGTATDTPSALAVADMVLSELTLSVDSNKAFSPDSQTEPDDAPVVMTLSGQPGGTARTGRMDLTDDSATFWNAYDFVGLDPSFTLTDPINLVRLLVYTGGDFVADGTGVAITGGEWKATDALTIDEFLADPLPEGITSADVQGVWFQFTDSTSSQWENPTNPRQDVPVLVQRRTDLRSGGAVLSDQPGNAPAPGETEAGRFSNSMTATAYSYLASGSFDVSNTSNATVAYEHLPSAVDVTKGPSGTQQPGTAIPYTITVTNTGQFPIQDPVIVDAIPTDADGPLLVLDPFLDPTGPGANTYTLTGTAPEPPSGTAMPVDPAEVDATFSATGDSLTWTFPAGTVLEVGQSYTIVTRLFPRIGLPGGTTITNTVEVSGERPFDTCNGTDDAVERCGATTDVNIASSGAAHSGKFVSATPLLGVSSPLAPQLDCVPGPDGFYAAPCVVVSPPGGTVDWLLAIQNTGNIPMSELILMDELPRPGDHGVLSELARESAWTPQFTGQSVLTSAPAGSTLETFVTTSPELCTADLRPITGSCEPGSWLPESEVTDLTTITAIKYVVTLPTPLEPADIVTLDFETTTPAVSKTAGSDTIAWNTVATGAALITGDEITPVEGTKVGAALATGSLEVLKTVSGAGAADYAPASFDVQLQCTSVGVALPPIALTVVAGVTQQVDDLPYGAECVLVEGDNGQTSSTPGAAATVVGTGETLEVATLDNVYDLASLTVSKTVSTTAMDEEGTPIGYGPFGLSVECRFLGAVVLAEGYDSSPMAVTLADGESATLTGLPAAATCTVAEPTAMDAVTVSISGSTANGDVGPGDAAGIDLVLTPDTVAGASTNRAEVVNSFSSGGLTITKVENGPGAGTFAGGPYTMRVTCVLDDATGSRTVWDDDVVLGGGQPLQDQLTGIATGASCSVEETVDGGATAVAYSPAGPYTIGEGTSVEVTVTNTFLTGSVSVVKTITGDAAAWADTSYTVSLSCIDSDGGPVTVPGGPDRILDVGNGFATEYALLPVGAECILVETDQGGASSSTILDEDGLPSSSFTVESETARRFEVVNTFDAGSIEVRKTVVGDGAERYAPDSFIVSLVCTTTIDGETRTVEIPGGAERVLDHENAYTASYEPLPDGAVCSLTEPVGGGATAVSFLPNSGDPTVGTAVVEADSTVVVSVQNRFDLGAVTVRKTIVGDAGAASNGTFTVSLVCTWDVDGVTTPIVIPGGGDRQLSRGTTLVASYDQLPVGALCEVRETASGGARSVTITPNVGDPRVGVIRVGSGAPAVVTVQNTFDPALSATGFAAGDALLIAVLLVFGGGLLGGATLLRRRRRNT